MRRTGWLKLFREVIAVLRIMWNMAKALCGQSVEFLNVAAGGTFIYH
jgi:hypothetical protein